jgi:hypothetical protein
VKWSAALIAILASCAVSQPDPVHILSFPPSHDMRHLAWLLDETLEHWDTEVGYRNFVPIQIESHSPHGAAGICRKLGQYREITIYVGSISRQHFDDQFRHVLLHELAHAHLDCDVTDHVDDPESVMHPKAGTVAKLDPLTIAKLRAAMGWR